MVIGVTLDPIEVTPVQLIFGEADDRFKAGPRERPRIRRTRCGSAELTGVRPMIETYPLERAAEALRAHDERQRTVPRRADDVRLPASAKRARRRDGKTNVNSLRTDRRLRHHR